MLNSVNLCGRICNDLELKTTTNGTSVITFTIAVDRDFTGSGEKQTDFINIVAWKSTAEFIKNYFSKGKLIIISGYIQTRKYTTQNGDNRSVTEVIARNVYFAGDKAKDAQSANNEPTATANGFEVPDEDSLPF